MQLNRLKQTFVTVVTSS